jgi:hypothetical protein
LESEEQNESPDWLRKVSIGQRLRSPDTTATILRRGIASEKQKEGEKIANSSDSYKEGRRRAV